MVISALLVPSWAEASVGKIEKVGVGSSVKVQRAGKTVHLRENDALEAGDEITTDGNTAVDLRLDDDTIIRVGINSSYKVQEDSKVHSLVHRLLSGVVRVLVKPTEGDHKNAVIKFRMQTQEGTIGVRGTEFVVVKSSGRTQLKGLDGEVLFGPADTDFANTSAFVSVQRGFESEIDAGSKGSLRVKKFNLREYLNQINGPGGAFGPLSGRVSGSANRYARHSAPPPAASPPVQTAASRPPPPPPPAPEAKERPAPPSKRDVQDDLMSAVLKGDTAAAKVAIDHGADVNLPSAKTEGHIPLELAMDDKNRERSAEMIGFLIQQGANVNLADAEGNTPLMFAASEKLDVEFAKILVNPGGADIDFANNAGKTAADMAKENGNTPLFKYLTSAEAQNDVKEGHKEAADRLKQAEEEKQQALEGGAKRVKKK